MAFNTVREYMQALTVSAAEYSPEIQNITYNATPLTALLKQRGRIKEATGYGPELRIPVQYDKLGSQWFSGYDYLKIPAKEIMSAAVFNYSRVVSMFSLSGDELIYNMSDGERIALLRRYMDTAVQGVREAFEEGLVSDGTGNDGRQMIGLGAAVPILPNVGVYGGVDRAAQPKWRTTTWNIPGGSVPDVTSWNSTSVRKVINHISLARSRGGNYPDLWIADANSYQAVDDAVVAHQRIVRDSGVGKLGFSPLSFTTPAGVVDVVAAGGVGNVMPSNTIYALDTKSLALYTLPGQDFVPFHDAGGAQPINQDAIANGITWGGQFVLENPLFSARVITA